MNMHEPRTSTHAHALGVDEMISYELVVRVHRERHGCENGKESRRKLYCCKPGSCAGCFGSRHGGLVIEDAKMEHPSSRLIVEDFRVFIERGGCDEP